MTHRNTIKNVHSQLQGAHSATLTNRDSLSMMTLSDSSSYTEGNNGDYGYGVTFNVKGEKGQGHGQGHQEGQRSGFALVINGHSMVFALSEELELLFLSVAENCSGELGCSEIPAASVFPVWRN